ncbi:hypothetical protein A1O3_03050 [Capronia epimyces CBS 606.96]|uniref:Uncharacterized protein n=1 Tax=Capronia epimyces CBS 606.96 TaxID=1182542 RepID=W9YBV5_9EURO|nr:uncharacterized protein A1O3_03050 [Capronia epimyces CBS 606.96]EXJ89983.1 hypothetical protein A1O3_03050 [Capronia epimyces CBS 606.96]
MTDDSSYELPHEAYTSHVYPRQSSNGSTVIIYGHEQGLRLVWYGGRSFKPPKQEVPHPKVNGTTKSDAMVIDLDDDDDEEPAARQQHNPTVDFEDYEDEVDPSAPFRDVLRYVDIPLGAAALQVAAPHIPKDFIQAPTESWPSVYLKRIVVAVACADSTIRIISAPLDPPAPEVKDVSKLDVQIVRIIGPNSHPEYISDIAITHTKVVSNDLEDNERIEAGSQSKQKSTESDAQQWSLLVASISCSGSGLLLVHQVPLLSNNALATDPDHLTPIRRQYLRSSSMSARLVFNTCPYPAERHSTLLIVLPAASCVKLYQVFPVHTRERRGSTATVDTVSSNRSLRTSAGGRGRFLITFLPSVIQANDTATLRRKRVLDAQWITAGRAVIALLEDGEWGIWDLEAVGPTSNSAGSNLIRGQGNISGIHGGSLTAFAVRSNIFSTAERKQKPANTSNQPTTGSLVPMTPSTRRTRSENLFHGQTGDDTTARPYSQQGSIHIEDKSSNRGRDESVIISYADGNVYIPSILSFWKSEGKPTRLPAIRYGGQQQRSISLFPKPDNDNSDSPGLFGIASSFPNFLIQTDHRLILSLSPLPAVSTTDAATQTEVRIAPPTSDQALLAAGDLDVDGMDRILEDMGASKPRPLNLFTKSVGFRIDEDMDDEDMDMGSPTPAKSSRPKLGSAPNSQVSQRRIFT